MYSFMAKIGRDHWVMVPLEVCPRELAYIREKFWLLGPGKKLNTLIPHKGTPIYKQLLRGNLLPPTNFDSNVRSQVLKEITCLRSSLSVREALSLLHFSERKVESSLWNQLFHKVSIRIKRETPWHKISLAKSITIRIPAPTPGHIEPLVVATRNFINNSSLPRGLKQFYTPRVVGASLKTNKVGELLCRSRFDFTPSSLNQILPNPCMCSLFPSICCPNPINHILIRSDDPKLSLLFDLRERRVLSQCLKNASAPTEAHFLSAIERSSNNVLNKLPGIPKSERGLFRRLIWDTGTHLFNSFSQSCNPIISPQIISSLKNKYESFEWGYRDKNTGAAFGYCKKFKAIVFHEHLLSSPRYQLVCSFNDPKHASNFVLSSIREKAIEYGLRKFLPSRWLNTQSPYSFFFFKQKSQEDLGLYKIRQLVSQAGHMLSDYASLMSRAFTVLIKKLASLDDNLEVFTMSETLDFFSNSQNSPDFPRNTPVGFGELDLVDMFLNINKFDILPSFDYMVNHLKKAPRQGNGRQALRLIKTIGVSLLDKSHDHLGSGPLELFRNVQLCDLRNFIEYEINGNNLFTAGGFVFAQLIGVPIGGKISAQIASMYLMIREIKFLRVDLHFQKVYLTRYRDNIYLIGPYLVVKSKMPLWIDILSEIYQIPVQFEQFGSSIDILEVTVSIDPSPTPSFLLNNNLPHPEKQTLSVRLRPKVLSPDCRSVSKFRRWPDKWSFNLPFVLRSLVPGMAIKASLWKMSLKDLDANVRLIGAEFGIKGYNINSWVAKFISVMNQQGFTVARKDLVQTWVDGHCRAPHLYPLLSDLV
mmetsp:Transcript_4530/g.8056  ORF Transcript_4530/g.8056 Transcript_4530/m.8056 type:complete len:815 (-) Transcript_4530:524-2968(-)